MGCGAGRKLHPDAASSPSLLVQPARRTPSRPGQRRSRCSAKAMAEPLGWTLKRQSFSGFGQGLGPFDQHPELASFHRQIGGQIPQALR